MARKLPVIIDNRKDNTVLQALQKLLPTLQKMDVVAGIFKDRSIAKPYWILVKMLAV